MLRANYKKACIAEGGHVERLPGASRATPGQRVAAKSKKAHLPAYGIRGALEVPTVCACGLREDAFEPLEDSTGGTRGINEVQKSGRT